MAIGRIIGGITGASAPGEIGQDCRMPEGGLIDRSQSLSFTFDGVTYQGHPGDTLASALLANGVRLVGRSFKYHRPRGIYSAGPEEPNAMVELREGGRLEPNTRATQIELFDGLIANSQHRWPSLKYDIGAVNSLMSPFFPAGFYYKTFMGPTRSAWMVYEALIRKAAGLGRASRVADLDRYEKRHGFCDVLVVGGGPAGLAAALAAGRGGARTVLVEQDHLLGGQLLSGRQEIEGKSGAEWAAAAEAELGSLPNVTLLTRTTAFGYYDGDTVGLVERVADHKPVPGDFEPRQRYWIMRCKQVVFASGAIERPLVFADNDRPGVMLAEAARSYANRFGVRAGKRAVVFAAHDAAYGAALDLASAGVEVRAVVDPRAERSIRAGEAEAAGIEVLTGHAVARAMGGRELTGALVAPLKEASLEGSGQFLDCDLLCVSGGWSPVLHLHSHAGGKTSWDERLATFVPGETKQNNRSVGGAAGRFMLNDCLREGFAGGKAAAEACGHTGPTGEAPMGAEEAEAVPMKLWAVPKLKGGKRFVDIQDDVTAEDVALANREGYKSVEHLKRYTTLGMGTDQGKTANVNGLAILAELRGEPVPQVGHTTFRPPYTPVAIGTLAGRGGGKHLAPVRRTALHDWHVKAGAVMVEAGPWMRPRYYPKAGEGIFEAQNREAKHVREKVGLVDVSTLGKIEVRGPDAALFLDRVYSNMFSTMKVGRARYGLMLREDGHVYDDGTTSRLADDLFYMTTTTANAAVVMANLEFYLQAVWSDLKVHVTSITDQWAGMAIAGPKSRAVLEKAVKGADVSDEGLPYMGVADAEVAGCPVRLFRMSFSGEMAYEVHTPSDYCLTVWEALLEAGKEEDIIPYGTEAMAVLRIEKGHVAGQELDGRTTPADLGLPKLASQKKHYIGERMLKRPALQDPNRPSLVGLRAVDGKSKIRGGAILIAESDAKPGVEKLGNVTSVTWSENLGKPIALGFLRGGTGRIGERLYAASPVRNSIVEVEVISPHMYDPEGEKLRG